MVFSSIFRYVQTHVVTVVYCMLMCSWLYTVISALKYITIIWLAIHLYVIRTFFSHLVYMQVTCLVQQKAELLQNSLIQAQKFRNENMPSSVIELKRKKLSLFFLLMLLHSIMCKYVNSCDLKTLSGKSNCSISENGGRNFHISWEGEEWVGLPQVMEKSGKNIFFQGQGKVFHSGKN